MCYERIPCKSLFLCYRWRQNWRIQRVTMSCKHRRTRFARIWVNPKAGCLRVYIRCPTIECPQVLTLYNSNNPRHVAAVHTTTRRVHCLWVWAVQPPVYLRYVYHSNHYMLPWLLNCLLPMATNSPFFLLNTAQIYVTLSIVNWIQTYFPVVIVFFSTRSKLQSYSVVMIIDNHWFLSRTAIDFTAWK